MFPLPVATYVRIAIGALLVLGVWYSGWRVGHSGLLEYKAAQAVELQKLQESHQAAADEIRKTKDAKIDAINAQLANAISELRKRPGRAETTDTGSCGTGRSLYAEDAEFLIRESARADKIRTGLEACYKQYDSLN